jgi:molybdopterin-containing oxidoreductase family iron-sulfur binding subunit
MSPVKPQGGLADSGSSGLRRREALKLLASTMALAASGCGKPHEEIVPYVEIPERLTPGIPLKFATTLALGGYGRGVIVTSHEGRPTKIEGNPRHPGSLGATDIFAEAEIFDLYSPDRSQAVRQGREIRSWADFESAWQKRQDVHHVDEGAGLRLLTGRITSPTLLRQIKALQSSYPRMVWHAYEPLDGLQQEQPAKIAFKRPLEMLPRLSDASVVLSLDSRFLDAGPGQIPMGRAYSDRRRARRDTKEMLRLYAVEPVPSLTGASADHVLALSLVEIERLACVIANGLGANLPDPGLGGDLAHFSQVVLADLKSNAGRGLVLAGPALSPDIRALVCWINAKLNAPVTYLDPIAGSDSQPGLEELMQSLDAGQVRTLIAIDCNPVYDAPADIDFKGELQKAEFRAHLSQVMDETSALCEWRLPASHALESWSDLRALDGTASIVQPLIDPLYDTRSAHDLIAIVSGSSGAKPYDLVRDTWRSHASKDEFEGWWRKALQDGVIPGTGSQPADPGEPALPEIKMPHQAEGATLVLSADPSLWDGRFAQNAWLQECPKPFTKQVWGNALGMNKADAAKAGLRNGDKVRLLSGQRQLEVPVLIQEGHADGVMSLTLGSGRTAAGVIGSDVGVNAFALRETSTPWVLDRIKIERVAAGENIAIATAVTRLDAATKDLFPVLTLAGLPSANLKRNQESQPSLLPTDPRQEPAWAMVIDNTACIGCNACLVACQAENNIPVVGPEEIEWGRIMHWIRIDAYVSESGPQRKTRVAGFNPVPCMQCEKAPCEPVCPVAASVHDSEGLNVQVYNRCVGTRFCEANCPYKVRRFNFFGYASGQEYKNLGAQVLDAQKNPDVTVRARGVMEKCTYCIQRISRARRAAEKENREIRDGEVVTACEAACPTRAIRFGDLDRDSEVRRLRSQPQHYALLGHLGTRPRTTYLARVFNPNPALEKGEG